MRFRGGVELSKFVGSLDIIPEAYRAISETNLSYELHTSPSGINVLAFNYCTDYTTRFLEGEFALVPSKNLQILHFISTKVNPSFSVNEAAVELFQNLGDDLKELENKHIYTPLIITGSGLGGYLAILSTLRLHHAIDVEESNDLQSAIEERPHWKFSFLNVVSKKDPVASFFSSNSPYKPLGTFLFCTESGCHTTFEDEYSIMPVLDAIKSSNAAGNNQICDYKNVLSSIRKKALYRGVSALGEFNLNLLRAGITLQLKEVGVLDHISNDQIEKMEKKQIDMIKSKNEANSYDHIKKLNEMKISLTYMEWYMKTRKRNGGYYDVYKAEARVENASKQEIVTHQRRLNQYWKKIVREKDLMPLKEDEKFRVRWLYAGTNYRRIVEPLDIARYYYIENKVNYIENRPNHYKLLEKWSNEDKQDSNLNKEKRNKAASLTEDSCFRAHMEEALISLRGLVNGGPVSNEKELEQFEAYVMCAINNYSVSPDIFLKGSSLMTWWNEYKAYKGTTYASEFAQYMNNKGYKSYQ
ncbi:hypothetical protein L1987_43864 [Smallanthus sonchifolius]|uniref:Uncharacterized protein n=1 Tax=Smallanthus sonchifolius TaxID=185202 RepID=A0ACB9GMT6_9ASTR|nr:hypothetical protein L1987_43864 [Smallanthus sonchifolius]